jgi:hypothetical protein
MSPKIAKCIEKEIMCKASHLESKTHESGDVWPTLGMMELEVNIPSKHIQSTLLSCSKPIVWRRIKLIKEKNTCITHVKAREINEHNYWGAMAKVREEGRSNSKGKVGRSVSSKRYMGQKRACREKKHKSQFFLFIGPLNPPTPQHG